MNRPLILAAAVGLALLAGCGQTVEPSPPPTSEDALTTTSAAADETEAAPTTEAPETEEPEAEGPPEMPDEATEQTEAGAEAFALHYIDLINYKGMHPQTGLLEPLGADGCKSCANHEETVQYSVEHSEVLSAPLWSPNDTKATLFAADDAVVHVDVKQHALEVLDASGSAVDKVPAGNYELVFELQPADPWRIKSIKVLQ